MKEEKKIAGMLQEAGPFLTLGAQLAATVIVFFFAGKYADEYFGTKPWIMVGAVVAGAAGGMIKFFRTVIRIGEQEEHERRSKT